MKSDCPNIEIMAPVGCWESLAAALQAGATSVYFGIEHLNMRARSSVNFTTDDMSTIVATCREAGVKTYLTVNTVMYPEDLPLMRQIVDKAHEVGVDAVIASDIAVMQYANSIGQEVHLSTQLNIANTEALKFYAQFADVVVLARELNMEQVASIYRDITEQHICGRNGAPIRIEMFCHGALCMAVSGKCYLSLNNYGLSANRGACVQVCRRGYTVKDKSSDLELDIDNQYVMSPKDLKTIHFLNKMLDAGVRVLKIEGRARGAEYVSTVVRCYKEAVEAWQRGEYADDAVIESKIAEWNERLSRVFNRGFWDGYYQGQKLGEWTHSYGNKATRKKLYAAKCTNFFKNLSVAEFLVEAVDAVEENQECLITGETTGVIETRLSGLRDTYGKPAKKIHGSPKPAERQEMNRKRTAELIITALSAEMTVLPRRLSKTYIQAKVVEPFHQGKTPGLRERRERMMRKENKRRMLLASVLASVMVLCSFPAVYAEDTAAEIPEAEKTVENLLIQAEEAEPETDFVPETEVLPEVHRESEIETAKEPALAAAGQEEETAPVETTAEAPAEGTEEEPEVAPEEKPEEEPEEIPEETDEKEPEPSDEEDTEKAEEEETESEIVEFNDDDAGTVSEEMLEIFNNPETYEKIDFDGTVDIVLKDSEICFGGEVTLVARVSGADMDYRLVWEANDGDGRGWYAIGSGSEYTFILTRDNAEREYRVSLYRVD